MAKKKTIKNKITGLNNLFFNFRPTFLPSKGSLDTSSVPIIILDLCKWPAGINVAFTLPPIPRCTHAHTHREGNEYLYPRARSYAVTRVPFCRVSRQTSRQ